MKHLQYFQKWKPVSLDTSGDAPGSRNKSCNGNARKPYKQTVTGAENSSHNQNVADWIRIHCLYMLMFVLTGCAVVGKIKNYYEKNVSITKGGLELLRVIFLAIRRAAPGQLQKIQSSITAFINRCYGDCTEVLLTQFQTIVPDLHARMDAFSVTSETVVSTLCPCTFLWLPH